ncbi:MAG TPA: HDOD domain-containing protein [Polyangiales bacterium]|nr:HDOD domain-containing protein [Polyangiales bacterium]
MSLVPKDPAPQPKPKPSPGSANLQLRLDDLKQIDATELQRRLLELFRSPNYKPPVLPAIAFELTELSRRKTVSYDEVARTVEKDPVIAGSLLKLAQSPLYGGGRARVQSLRDALNRLGVNKLRDAVWQVVMDMRLFRADGFSEALTHLQSHTAFTAHAARIIAQHASLVSEHAFLAGLIHDVGWNGMLIVISEISPSAEASPPLMAALDHIHSEVGATMVKMWGVSDEIVELVRTHHDPPAAGKPVSPLFHAVRLAEKLAIEFGFAGQRMLQEYEDRAALLGEALAVVDASPPDSAETAIAALGLTNKMDLVREQVEQAALQVEGGQFSD